jgi:hypothetical protein
LKLEDLEGSGGFLEVWPRLADYRSEHYMETQGAIRKTAHLPPTVQIEDAGEPAGLVIEITSDWRHQGLGQAEERGEEKGRSGRGSPRVRRSGSGRNLMETMDGVELGLAAALAPSGGGAQVGRAGARARPRLCGF